MIPPAAAFIEEFITIAFFLIAIVSWIIRLVGQSREESQAEVRRAKSPSRQPGRHPSQNPGRRSPPQRPTAPSPADAQSQIDEFLKRSAGRSSRPRPASPNSSETPEKTSPQPASRRSPAAAETEAPVVILEDGHPSEWDRRFQERRRQLTSTIAERHLPSAVGSELAGRVEEVLDEAALFETQRDQAQEELAEARQRIEREKNRQEATSPPPAQDVRFGTGTRDVAALLKGPRTARTAIVINAVLSPPPALQRSGRMPGPVRTR